MAETTGEYDWLDIRPAKTTGLEKRARIMRDGAMQGKDRVWWTDGSYVWFRRKKSNPATLQRHQNFLKTGDYKFVETQGDVEIYELQESSPFKPKKTIDVTGMDLYNLRRQAALAACKRQWKTFQEIVCVIRERINNRYRSPGRNDITPLAENVFADNYIALMESIHQRNGPSPAEINKELTALAQKNASAATRLITVG